MPTYINDIVVIVILFVTNLIQAITGFAGTLLGMPPTIKLIGVSQSKALLNAVAIISCLAIAISSLKYVNWKEFFKMLFFMFLGMWVGIQIFKIYPLHNLLFFYGCMIICIAIWKLFVKKDIQLPKFCMICVIFVAGIIHGMFVSGGALLVIYAVNILKDKNEFRATLSLMWVVCGLYLFIGDVQANNFTPHVMYLFFVGLIPLFVSIWAGTILVKKINQELFLIITYCLLIVSGIFAII